MTIPRLRLRPYGEVEAVPANPTWDDIERRALTNPMIRGAVSMVRLGEWTRQEALIHLALTFANDAVRTHEALVDAHNSSAGPMTFIVNKP